MKNQEQIYSRRTYVCWPVKIGGFSATWPFGKIIITPKFVEIGSLFTKGQKINKMDIINIEFVNKISDKFFYINFLGENKLCKININRDGLPKWLAFLSNEKDVIKLKELGYTK